MYGPRGNNEKGQCQFMHPRKCIYFETRGCKKGNSCDFYHAGNGVNMTNHGTNRNNSFVSNARHATSDFRHPRTNHFNARPAKSGAQQPENKDVNGNDRDSGAQHVTRVSQNKGPSIDMAFLGQSMLKLLQDHLKNNGEGKNRNSFNRSMNRN